MGNGTVASKFRLNTKPFPSVLSSESDIRDHPKTSDTNKNEDIADTSSSSSQVEEKQVLFSDHDAATHESASALLKISQQNKALLNDLEAGHKSRFKLDKSVGQSLKNKLPNGKPDLEQSSFIISTSNSIERPETHHPSNCVRCYRLKKKCTRSYPSCSNCARRGSPCEYIDRSIKKKPSPPNPPKRKYSELPEAVPETSKKASTDEVPSDRSEDDQPAAEVFHILDESKSSSPNSTESLHLQTLNGSDTQVVAHKLVSISSLLSSDEHQLAKLNHHEKDSLQRNRRNTQSNKKSLAKYGNESSQDLANIVSQKASGIIGKSSTNLKEEFINMKAFPTNDLPLSFALNYFQNYEWYYPFIEKNQFFESFNKIDFQTETILNLDMYLLLSIGCLIYDHNTGTDYFTQFFSYKVIESIANVIQFDSLIRDDHNGFDLENIKLFLLLCIFGLHLFNEGLCWASLGLLTRLMVQFNYHRPTEGNFSVLKERIFWSVHNLDKELSLLVDRPSQLPINDYIALELPLKEKLNEQDESDTFIKLLSKRIELHKLQDQVNYLKLTTTKKSQEETSEVLKEFSSNLEKWRISMSLLIHTEYSGLPNLQEMIGVINLNYYFLLIEMDQVSSSESFQFTLQFLSSSFGLLLTDSSKPESDKTNADKGKPTTKISMNSLFWYKKFFKVIKYNLISLLEIANSVPESSTVTPLNLSLKLSEFNGNLQLMINLLRYTSQGHIKPSCYSEKIDTAINTLSSLNMELMKNGIVLQNKDSLIHDIQRFQTLI